MAPTEEIDNVEPNLLLRDRKTLSHKMLDLLVDYTSSQADLDVCRSVRIRDATSRALAVSAATEGSSTSNKTRTSLDVGLCGADSGCVPTGTEACLSMDSDWNNLLTQGLINRLSLLNKTADSMKVEHKFVDQPNITSK